MKTTIKAIYLIVCLILLILVIDSCKKESIVPLVGGSYHIKGNIFNKGAFQPAQPVKINSLYTDPASGLPYVNATDQNGLVWYLPQEDLKP